MVIKNGDEKLLLRAEVSSVVVNVEYCDVLILRCDMIASAALVSRIFCLCA